MKNFRQIVLSASLFLGAGLWAGAQNNVVWQIGVKDDSYAEFAVAERGYNDITKVFPDAAAVYSVGQSGPQDIPFVMPGQDDAWAGRRKGTLMVRFNVASNVPDKVELVMDMVEIHPSAPPRLRIELNDFSTEIRLPAGKDQNFLGKGIKSAPSIPVRVSIPARSVLEGDNVLRITNVAGSWTVLDDIRLEASGKIALAKVSGGVSLASVKSVPALVYGKDGKELRSPVIVSAVNWGKKTVRAKCLCDGSEIGTVDLAPGLNSAEISIPEQYQDKDVKIDILCGKEKMETTLRILPAEKWTIYLVQQTHTDIGYTKPQTEILTEHLRYIDYAIEYCEATESYPDDSRFRWTCEASWAVREWLKSRPQEQIEKFLHYVRNGQIEVTAMFFNMSELSGEDNYKTFLSPIKTFREMGIPVVTAMQNDVNGVAWCLADYLSGIGVKYLTMGSNGHRADIPFDRPTLYKWESPSGNSLISYRSDHYNTANRWGIDKEDDKGVESGVFSYISSLKHRGYDIPLVSVQYSGYYTDNSPPSMREANLIRRWNDHYAWPKLRSATIREFLDRVDSEYSDNLPVYRAAYPDWWTDGFGSAARETAASRTTQSDMLAIGGMLSMAAFEGDSYPFSTAAEIDRINENLLFYNEHTFGAAESIRNPLCENSQVQWAEKGSYVWDALKNTQMMYEAAAGRLQGKLYRGERPTLTFFNAMARPRTELVKVYIDYELVPRDKNFSIVDEDGRKLKWQPLNSRSEGRYYAILAEDIPAMGYRTYELVVEGGNAVNPHWKSVSGEIEIGNEFYTLAFDGDRGGVSSIIDKETGAELIDQSCEWTAGAVIYESLEGDRHQMERKVFEKYSREGLTNVRFTGISEGSIYTSVNYKGKLRGCSDAGVRVEVRLFNDVKRIEFSYSLQRLPETDPSGIYVAFPVELPDGKLYFDVPGGTVCAGENQIPRTSAGWNTVQNYVAARNAGSQVIVSSDEIPLFMMGELLNDPYRLVHKHEKQHIYSWVMNNYWTTNFRASQEGELRWSYALTSTKDASNSAATEFGRSNRVPVYARVMPSSKTSSYVGNPRERSFINVEAPNLTVASCWPSRFGGKSVILNIVETDGRPTELKITGVDGKLLPYSFVNVLEESVEGRAEVAPKGNVFVKIEL